MMRLKMKIKLIERFDDWRRERWEYRNVYKNKATKIPQDILDMGNEIKALLESFMPQEVITEDYQNEYQLKKHFYEHCLNNNEKRKSRKTNVYYDFDNIDDYKKYVDYLTTEVMETEVVVHTVYDKDLIQNAFEKLFNGESIRFSPGCDLENKVGYVQVGFVNDNSIYTTNYSSPTVSMIILALNGKTITAYPLDKDYSLTKFFNIIDKYSGSKSAKRK